MEHGRHQTLRSGRPERLASVGAAKSSRLARHIHNRAVAHYSKQRRSNLQQKEQRTRQLYAEQHHECF